MTSSARGSDRSLLRVVLTQPAQERLAIEARAWELLHEGEKSQLPDEVDAAVELLARHPYIGTRARGRGRRKLHLRRTGFVLMYQVKPRLRIVTITALLPDAGLRHRK